MNASIPNEKLNYNLLSDDELIYIINKNPDILNNMTEIINPINNDIKKVILGINGLFLEHIEPKKLTMEMKEIAISQNPNAIKYLVADNVVQNMSIKLWSKAELSLWYKAIELDNHVVKYIDKNDPILIMSVLTKYQHTIIYFSNITKYDIIYAVTMEPYVIYVLENINKIKIPHRAYSRAFSINKYMYLDETIGYKIKHIFDYILSICIRNIADC